MQPHFSTAATVAVLAYCISVSTAQNVDENTCEPGTFRDGDICSFCPENTFSSFANVTSCTPCPRRTFSISGSSGKEQCKRCRRGSVFDEDKGTCETCPNDTFTRRKGARRCSPCPAGTVSAPGAQGPGDCRNCPRGTQVVRRQRASFVICVECPVGQTTFVENSDSCSGCPEGTFRDKSTTRTNPPDVCEPCRVGTFGDETGLRRCKRCPVGFFQNELGQTSCKKCPEDSTSRGLGSQSCFPTCIEGSPGCTAKACLPGFGINPVTNECEECPPGTVSPGLSTTPCFPCPVGDGTVNAARTKCVCTPGFRLLRNGNCQECESGFSNEDGGKCMCVLNTPIVPNCECGPFSKQIGNSCVACDPKFDTRCIKCSSGEFFNRRGRRCEQCPANTFATIQSRCRPCPNGTTSMPGSTSCS